MSQNLHKVNFKRRFNLQISTVQLAAPVTFIAGLQKFYPLRESEISAFIP